MQNTFLIWVRSALSPSPNEKCQFSRIFYKKHSLIIFLHLLGIPICLCIFLELFDAFKINPEVNGKQEASLKCLNTPLQFGIFFFINYVPFDSQEENKSKSPTALLAATTLVVYLFVRVIVRVGQPPIYLNHSNRYSLQYATT